MVETVAAQHYEKAISLHCAGRFSDAIREYGHALALRPDWIEALYNCGLAFSSLERWAEARQCFDRVLTLKPEFSQAYNERGISYYAQGAYQEAIASYDRAECLSPGYPDALINRGAALYELRRFEEALACVDRVLSRQPDHILALNNRGNALREVNRLEEALACYDLVIAINPGHAGALNNRGTVLCALDRYGEAIESYRRALQFKPGYAEAHRNLGLVFLKQGAPDTADECFNKALALKPDYAQAYCNLGTSLLQRNKPEAAIENFRRALEFKRDYVEAYSDSLLTLLYRSSVSPDASLAAHRAFAERYETLLKVEWPKHRRAFKSGARLKIGYVSPDFRNHAVARFIEPVLANHDAGQVEVFCYYNNFKQDAVTANIAALAEHWVVCKGWSDTRLAERIQADGIDVLVDLAGHTGDGRLLTFARKPAPLQLSYLGYATTTGLSSMDYRLSHADVDPLGHDKYYSENLYRLPRSLWCYRPPVGVPEVWASLPAISNGYITFGSMNNLVKISPETFQIWAHILRNVSSARLVMTGIPEGSIRREIEDYFSQAGVSTTRLRLEGRLPDTRFWELMQSIDIALDTFPYNGTTTTCESLWMGLPVISLKGQTAVARSGYALLKSVGLEELVALDTEHYGNIAIELARDYPRLEVLRRELRPRMEASPLRDEAGFTRELECAYLELRRREGEAADLGPSQSLSKAVRTGKESAG